MQNHKKSTPRHNGQKEAPKSLDRTTTRFCCCCCCCLCLLPVACLAPKEEAAPRCRSPQTVFGPKHSLGCRFSEWVCLVPNTCVWDPSLFGLPFLRVGGCLNRTAATTSKIKEQAYRSQVVRRRVPFPVAPSSTTTRVSSIGLVRPQQGASAVPSSVSSRNDTTNRTDNDYNCFSPAPLSPNV